MKALNKLMFTWNLDTLSPFIYVVMIAREHPAALEGAKRGGLF